MRQSIAHNWAQGPSLSVVEKQAIGLQFTSADQAYNLGIWRTSCGAPLPPLTLSHCLYRCASLVPILKFNFQ